MNIFSVFHVRFIAGRHLTIEQRLSKQINIAAIVFISSCVLLTPGCGSSGSADSKNVKSGSTSAATSAPNSGAPGEQAEAVTSVADAEASAEQNPSSNQNAQPKTAAAIKRAEELDRFLIVLITGGDPAKVSAMKDSLRAAINSLGDKADTLVIDASDPSEKDFMGKYGVGSRGGLPMVLIFASNGAVAGGNPGSVSTGQIKQAMSISPLMAKVIKPLQEQKVALVALQNAATQFNAESWAGVSEFANDPTYKQLVSAIKADPAAAESQEFLKQCQLIGPLTQATVVVLLPPGRIGKILSGKVTKADILGSLQACAAGSSCAPGGCSDRRFKQNIEPVASALEKVTRLQGVNFTWNRKDYPRRFFSDDRQIGVIAQDVESVIPEVVHTDKEGFKSVEYDKLTAVLIEAVKEMNTKIVKQDSLIKEQNAKIKALEAKYK